MLQLSQPLFHVLHGFPHAQPAPPAGEPQAPSSPSLRVRGGLTYLVPGPGFESLVWQEQNDLSAELLAVLMQEGIRIDLVNVTVRLFCRGSSGRYRAPGFECGVSRLVMHGVLSLQTGALSAFMVSRKNPQTWFRGVQVSSRT